MVLCIVIAAIVAGSFAVDMASGADHIGKYGSIACFWAGTLCALCSAYFFLVAPIEDVVLAIVLFGCAVGLELIAALLRRRQDD